MEINELKRNRTYKNRRTALDTEREKTRRDEGMSILYHVTPYAHYHLHMLCLQIHTAYYLSKKMNISIYSSLICAGCQGTFAMRLLSNARHLGLIDKSDLLTEYGKCAIDAIVFNKNYKFISDFIKKWSSTKSGKVVLKPKHIYAL